MDMEQHAGASGDIAERGLRYTKDQFDQLIEQTEEYVRENPTRALLYGVPAGFILDRLPIFRILGGVPAPASDGIQAGHPGLRRDQTLPGSKADE